MGHPDEIHHRYRSTSESDEPIVTRDECIETLGIPLKCYQNVRRWQVHGKVQTRQLVIDQEIQRKVQPHILQRNIVLHNKPITNILELDDEILEPKIIYLPTKEYVVEEDGSKIELTNNKTNDNIDQIISQYKKNCSSSKKED